MREAGSTPLTELRASLKHPCFSGEASANRGRIHLPVSPSCNIQCRFCRRAFNKAENRPGVTSKILRPEEAVEVVRKSLELCPGITVAGIAGPGDTLATDKAIKTFEIIHREFPYLINCMSTNGLLLELYAADLVRVWVKTLTVTVNAVDPAILDRIVSHVLWEGETLRGTEAAAVLIGAQKRGIKKAADLGLVIKINIVLIPGVNDDHIGEIAKTVSGLGASIINIIPLLPQNEFSGWDAPGCEALNRAREEAEKYLPVFKHCQHCRADAIGIPGRGDISSLVYGEAKKQVETEETFSHG
ncbi:MAG: radical SAM protein [Spirochaetaceae bacterium]|jgi:nitrogen fixation protein NifB|nr:radical SAM protein [Spirochaetaceae bacterium]